MKFLVVGASGFLGRHLRRHLLQAGHQVSGTQTRSDPSTGLVRFDLEHDRIVDVLPAAFFDEPTHVVVCSCVTPMDRCRSEPQRSHTINVENIIRLCDDVAAHGAKVVFVSSSYVFDGADGYYTEEHPHNPVSAYGLHKSLVDRYLTARQPDALVLRLDKIIGDDPAEGGHPFSEWWRAAAQERPVVCIQGQILSPTFVDDIACGIRVGCEQGLRGAYHLANSEYFGRDELARQFFRAVGVRAEVVCRPHDAFGFLDARPIKPYLDSTRFRQATGMTFTSMRSVMARFAAGAESSPRAA